MRLNTPAFEQQARFVEVRLILESYCCGALTLSENGAIIPMNFQCPIVFAICRSSNAAFATDRLCVEISGALGLPFNDCHERGCWGKIPFIIGMEDRGNLGVIFSDRSPKHDTQSLLAVPVVFLRVELGARADLQDKSILGEAIHMGKKFQRKFGKLHGRPATKQDGDSQAVYSSLSWVFARMGPRFNQRLAAADCSGISSHLFVVLGGESAGFARLPGCRFIAIIVPVQSIPLSREPRFGVLR
jgi:hypothetical protein